MAESTTKSAVSRTSTRTSATSSGARKHTSSTTQTAQVYLGKLLPTGWSNYFVARRAGKYWGLSVICPVCKAKAPDECDYGLRRWRWLSVHMAEEHSQK
jgi:hypothetical protein